MRKGAVWAGAVAACALVAAVIGGCAARPSAPADGAASSPAATLPDPDAGFDYQLGGPSSPPEGVTVVERDRTAPPAGAGYDICYVNGFQTQPDASAAFAKRHPDLVLRAGGKPLADPGWPDEYLFDTSTRAKRAAIAATVGEWIEGCARDGFDAVEIDNLDSYTRSHDALTVDDNLALAADYARIAHGAGLAIAQKNTADQTRRLAKAGYDFAVTESCFAYQECDAYTSVYPVVLDIEYTDELGAARFGAACASDDRPSAMILRDHDLVASSDPAHVYRSCPPRP
ncbi:endo alpha-1,4 polygalactosaminidase [Leifsonia sp. NPDC080035]|uniref:Endo alpha-1,4 polygalactosaminidase n=1 Tax=Leifsonia sp. NPDC080035 TaxID=3143936 RepID=A0AAU7GCT8_9MICO